MELSANGEMLRHKDVRQHLSGFIFATELQQLCTQPMAEQIWVLVQARLLSGCHAEALRRKMLGTGQGSYDQFRWYFLSQITHGVEVERMTLRQTTWYTLIIDGRTIKISLFTNFLPPGFFISHIRIKFIIGEMANGFRDPWEKVPKSVLSPFQTIQHLHCWLERWCDPSLSTLPPATNTHSIAAYGWRPHTHHWHNTKITRMTTVFWDNSAGLENSMTKMNKGRGVPISKRHGLLNPLPLHRVTIIPPPILKPTSPGLMSPNIWSCTSSGHVHTVFVWQGPS